MSVAVNNMYEIRNRWIRKNRNLGRDRMDEGSEREREREPIQGDREIIIL